MLLLTIATSGAAVGGLLAMLDSRATFGSVVFGMLWTAGVSCAGLAALYELTGGA